MDLARIDYSVGSLTMFVDHNHSLFHCFGKLDGRFVLLVSSWLHLISGMVKYPAKDYIRGSAYVICIDLSKIQLVIRKIANGHREVDNEMQNMWISFMQNEYVYHSLSVCQWFCK